MSETDFYPASQRRRAAVQHGDRSVSLSSRDVKIRQQMRCVAVTPDQAARAAAVSRERLPRN